MPIVITPDPILKVQADLEEIKELSAEIASIQSDIYDLDQSVQDLEAEQTIQNAWLDDLES